MLPIVFKFYGFNGALWVIATNSFFSIPLTYYYKKINGILDIKRELMACQHCWPVLSSAKGWRILWINYELRPGSAAPQCGPVEYFRRDLALFINKHASRTGVRRSQELRMKRKDVFFHNS